MLLFDFVRPAHQLLGPSFNPDMQPRLWPEESSPLRFVVKLHQATYLHYDFRLEVAGRLFSLAIDDVDTDWSTPVSARRVGDHDPKYLLGERRIPDKQVGAGPMLIWDHGLYLTDAGTEEDVYRQLLNGCLEVEMHGIRLQGRFRISGAGKQWTIARLSGVLPQPASQSVLTGRSLREIGMEKNAPPHPSLFT